MTILDRGVPVKNKEDNAQARQQNHENTNRKQRSRPGHSSRDRTLSQHRVGRVSPNNDFNFWTDPGATHRRLSVDIAQSDNSGSKLQKDDLALRGHPKPRGLSKSNIPSTSNCDAFSATKDSAAKDMLHTGIDAQQALSKISHSSELNIPTSSQPTKNLGRGGKKNVDKKLSHKKKQRRSVPYNVNCKPIKSHSKSTAQATHQRLPHLKSEEPSIASATSENQGKDLCQYAPSSLLTNEGQFMEAGTMSHFDHYSNEAPNFMRTTAHSSAIVSQNSRNSPINSDNESISKEPNDTKHNSDDEHEQGRLQRLHHGVDFKQLESDFEQKLKSVRGFIIKPMGEDGACLFRAVADQVYGDQNMHDEVRKNCMNYMTQNADYYSNYVTEDFKSYIDRKRDLSAFGNHLEMQAMAELYNRPFEVYQYTTDPINTFQTSNLSTNPPIRVSYHQNSHYNAVIDPYKATIGVGLGLPSFKPGMVDKSMLNTALKASGEMWEQQMLNDKVQATDWESTDDAILEQVARESYMEYIEQKTSSDIQEVKDNHLDATKSKHKITDSACSKAEPLKIVKEFPKKNNKAATAIASDWIAEDEEWQVLSKVLANSQKEYMDVLKQQATHSKATCSKYT